MSLHNSDDKSVTSPPPPTHDATHDAPPAQNRVEEAPSQTTAAAFIRGMRAAFVFMSRLPVGGFPYSKEDWRWAPAHFPLVGVVVGLFGALVLWGSLPLGPSIASCLALLCTVYLTGAFHEDGLADSADALGGAHSRKKLHDILKDSRIGTYGACAIVFSLLLRCFLLIELLSGGRLSTCVLFVCVHGLSRVGPVVMMAALPYVAGEGAKGSSVADGGNWSRALVASLWGLLLLLGAFFAGVQLQLLGLWLLVLPLVTALLVRKFYKAAGGYTGDFLGASEQILELTLFGSALFVLRFQGWENWLL